MDWVFSGFFIATIFSFITVVFALAWEHHNQRKREEILQLELKRLLDLQKEAERKASSKVMTDRSILPHV
jgi:hypothetical protein